MLVVINLALLVTQPLAKVDPESLPSARTWVWWSTKEFLSLKEAPDVVLLGSSLLMHPVSRADADYLNRDLDYVYHHRSYFVEDKLKATLGRPELTCFNFAQPGSMVSDDYILTRAMLTGARKPKVIVLALGVRDFVESSIGCAAATPSFRYFKRFTDISDIVDLVMPHIWQRSDYLIGNWIYPWGKKLDLQVLLSEKAKTFLQPIFSKTLPPSKLALVDPSRNVPGNLRSEVEAGMMMVKAHQPYSFDDNTPEYRKRYRKLNKEMIAIQERFLEETLKLAHDQGIGVVMVNMPLTKANHALMQPGSYERYHDTIKAACARHNIPLVDLDGSADFSEADFYDTAHMNSSGGRKMLEALCRTISSEPQVVATLIGRPKVAARGKQL